MFMSFYHVCQKLILVRYVYEFLNDIGKDYACVICDETKRHYQKIILV